MNTWIIPCNINKYDVIGAFEKLNELNWKQSSNIKIGDRVYIYISSPIQAIKFETIVTKVNLQEVEIEDADFQIDNSNYFNYGRYMEIKLVNKFHKNLFPLKKLKENGLTNVQSPIKATKNLKNFINMLKEHDYHNLDVESEEYVVFFNKYKFFLEEFRGYLENTSPEGSGRPSSYIRHFVRLLYNYRDTLTGKDIYSSEFLEILESFVYDKSNKEFNSYAKNYYTASISNYRKFLKFYVEDGLNTAINTEVDILSKNNTTKEIQSKIARGKQKRPNKIKIRNIEVYNRNSYETLAAKEKSNWTCEIDKNHKTFISISNGKPYVEAHHLIPMEYQDKFENSIDFVNNIVSLCPNCHTKIHKASQGEKQEMISMLYNLRKDAIREFGIDISLKELLRCYKINM